MLDGRVSLLGNGGVQVYIMLQSRQLSNGSIGFQRISEKLE